MRLKYTHLFFLFLVISFTVRAQATQEGFVLVKNDTLRGILTVQTIDKSVNSITFKRNSQSKETEFQASDITGFGTQNEFLFLSKKVERIGKKPIFLEAIVLSEVSLYRYGDQFLLEKDYQITPLKSSLNSRIINGRQTIEKNELYKGQLGYLLADCSDIDERIYKTRLTEKSLTKLVSAYSTCMGQKRAIIKENLPWVELSWGVSAGYVNSSIVFNSHAHAQYLSNDFNKSNSVIFSTYLQLKYPRVSNKVSMLVGLDYFNSTYDFRNQGSFNGTSESSNINVGNLKLPIGIFYGLDDQGVTPFFKAGISPSIHLNASSNYTRTVTFNNQRVNDIDKEAVEFNNVQFGIWGGIGFKLTLNQKLSGTFEYRFEKTNGLNGFDRFETSSITNHYIIFGVLLD